jgi:chloramphenicol-sensitive protein RarD
LSHVPSPEILAHRIVWSLIFVSVLLSIQRRWTEAKAVLSRFSNIRPLLVSSFLIGVNWLIFIWAVTNGQIVEASLGYFILPILNVCLGVVLLRERLNRLQIFAVGCATAGVLYLTLLHGRVPWIALALAFTFGFYGLIRKTAPAESMVGMLYDAGIITPIVLIFLVYLSIRGHHSFMAIGFRTDLLLAGAGVVTATPMILFAHGARRIRYSTIGILQYIGPTGHLLLGVLLYREPFTRTHAVSFGTVWVGIVLYSISSLLTYNREKTRIPLEGVG